MAAVSIYLDTRYKKQSGKYPIRLRVFQSQPRKQKFYPTKFEFTKSEFNAIMKNNSRGINRERFEQLEALRVHSKSIADKITPFDFDSFELQIHKNKKESFLVKSFYEDTISQYLKNNQYGTADNYLCSMKSIRTFSDKKFDSLQFSQINKNFLEDYERHMEKAGKSPSTIGAYLRPLRKLFNDAIELNVIGRDKYPFRKKVYQIPAARAVKKALNSEQIKALWMSEPLSPEQIKAKDFWFLIYFLNGINIKDLALLKWKDINSNSITYYRAKTKRTSKRELKPIRVHLSKQAFEIIEKYGSNLNSEGLIFSIIDPKSSFETQQSKIKSFTKFLNQHIKKLSISIGLPEDISPYWARHSFATQTLRKGFNTELISQALGHNSINTTKAYLQGFEDDTLKELSEANSEFLNMDKSVKI